MCGGGGGIYRGGGGGEGVGNSKQTIDDIFSLLEIERQWEFQLKPIQFLRLIGVVVVDGHGWLL